MSRRVATSLAASVVALGLAMCSEVPAASPAEPRAAGRAAGVVLRVGTYNILAGVGTRAFRHAVHALLPRADVVGLQEVNSHAKEAVMRSMHASGWRYYRPKRRQSPVMWRYGRLRLVHARSVRIARGRHIGDEVPSQGSYVLPQYVTVVRLRSVQTGARISVVNVHLFPGAVSAGRRIPGRPVVWKLYVTEVANLAKVTRAERRWGRVFVLGDFNVGFVADQKHHDRHLPYATFKRMGMVSMWASGHPRKSGTRGTALLDQVYAAQRARHPRVAFAIRYSDHRPALANYGIARP
jgi:endonuclease/exonuclease/phosphatase family metal-dependent hydrolase